MKISRYSLLLLLALLLAAVPASGAARYRVTEITLPPEANILSSSWGGINKPGINNNGVVAGYYHVRGTSYDHEAFRWEKGVTTRLDHLANDFSYMTFAYDINNLDQIVGYSGTSCLWQNTNPPSPTALPGGYGQEAFGINNSGQVVGVAPDSNGSGRYAVRWESDVRTYLSTFGHEAEAFDINENGLIVGMALITDDQHIWGINWPVLWRDGGIINLEDLVVDATGVVERGGRAYAINDHNQVVGYASANIGEFGGWRAFLWENNVMKALGALFEDRDSCALAINNLGQIVGYSYSKVPPYGNHAILWEKEDIIDLNTRIDPIPGWYLREARAINDRGQIVCLAADHDFVNFRFYLLTPVSSTAAINLLLLGD
jgi:probable HAF family extracellular repeat protein